MTKKKALRLFLVLSLPLIFVFSSPEKSGFIPSSTKKVEQTVVPDLVPEPDQKHYPVVLQNIENSRKELIKQHSKGSSDALKTAAAQWTVFMTDSIFPYWYGTEWDFNGHTDIPNSGEIACGYFVSTTMRHSGVILNRYKLAQKAASDIIASVCKNSSAKWFGSMDDLIDFLEKEPDGLYVLGLDNHVGFVLHENGSSYFIHSDYISDEVRKEDLATSDAALNTQRYYIGSLTGNSELIEGWLNGAQVVLK